MNEERAQYLLQPDIKRATMDTDLDKLRTHLAEMERQLISMLVTVQRAQGKESSIITRSERRRR